jgi:hypothetical protein
MVSTVALGLLFRTQYRTDETNRNAAERGIFDSRPASLPTFELAQILPSLESVSLTLGQPLHDG